MLLNNTVTPMIIWYQAMSYLSVPIPVPSSLNDVAKWPKYLSKSAFYDNLYISDVEARPLSQYRSQIRTEMLWV